MTSRLTNGRSGTEFATSRNRSTHAIAAFKSSGSERIFASIPQRLALCSDGVSDVVLTDYRMAEMDGHELLNCIKDRDPHAMAETLGINVTTLWRKRRRYKLD